MAAKRTFSLPKLSVLDILIGFGLTVWITDSFVDPHILPHAHSYGMKMVGWLIGTVIFVGIGLLLTLLIMAIHDLLRRKRQ